MTITAYGLNTRTWTFDETSKSYGCSECCNGEAPVRIHPKSEEYFKMLEALKKLHDGYVPHHLFDEIEQLIKSCES
jgi:hypothetical protein